MTIVPAENKAKRLSSVNHFKAIHHHPALIISRVCKLSALPVLMFRKNFGLYYLRLGIPSGPIMPSTTAVSSTASTTTTTAGATGNTASATEPLNQLFGQLLNSMPQNNAATAQPSIPPEQRYQIQLEQLASMGFHDRAANIRGEINLFFVFIDISLLLLKILFAFYTFPFAF